MHLVTSNPLFMGFPDFIFIKSKQKLSKKKEKETKKLSKTCVLIFFVLILLREYVHLIPNQKPKIVCNAKRI
jgi:hypothetical protein